ncbi:DUF3613 domain-containing protein [Stenotrophomonas sp. NPDC077659]|uniref:DUF3613 domain-containing protein n=1 Tax=Stenotrophomonas sp. NPDC077659 TaxID=3390694 RepID=UPI003D028681
MTATPLFRRLLPALAGTLLVAAAHAQPAQQPLTGQMLGSPPAATTAPTAHAQALPTVDLAQPAPPPPALAEAPPPPPRASRSGIGDTTRGLFRLQASGQQAGARLPILGDQASASYARYMKSFDHEIPDFFETGVGKARSGAASSP